MDPERLQRALEQRILLVDQELKSATEMWFKVLGTSGTTYKVVVSEHQSCTCPDYTRRNKKCKHIYFVLRRVLNASDTLVGKEQLTVDELKQLFSGPKIIPTATTMLQEQKGNEVERRPLDEECPVCYEPMDQKKEDIIYCFTTCGYNMHLSCYKRWHNTSRHTTNQCPMCRTVWNKLQS